MLNRMNVVRKIPIPFEQFPGHFDHRPTLRGIAGDQHLSLHSVKVFQVLQVLVLAIGVSSQLRITPRRL